MHWLPVDTLLGGAVSRSVEDALAPLADQARRIRRIGIWGTSLTAASAFTFIIWSFFAEEPSVLKILGLCSAVAALLLAVQATRLWDGHPRWWRWYGQPPVKASLPEEAVALLAKLQAGKMQVRYRRGQSDVAKELPLAMVRGPFGPLLLSSNADVQALALWDWFGGNRLSVEFCESGAVPDGSLLSPIPSAESEAAPPKPGVASVSESRFNRFLLMDADSLERVLRVAFPDGFDPDPHRRSQLIVRTFFHARSALEQRSYRTVTELREHVIRKLQADDMDHYGLNEESDRVSASWLEKALSPAGYPSIQRQLEAAEASIEAK